MHVLSKQWYIVDISRCAGKDVLLKRCLRAHEAIAQRHLSAPDERGTDGMLGRRSLLQRRKHPVAFQLLQPSVLLSAVGYVFGRDAANEAKQTHACEVSHAHGLLCNGVALIMIASFGQ